MDMNSKPYDMSQFPIWDNKAEWERMVSNLKGAQDEQDIRDALYSFFVDLRRNIAKDGPDERPEGALQAFDQSCDSLGVPFLKP